MWAASYWAKRYWTPGYWVGAATSPPTSIGGYWAGAYWPKSYWTGSFWNEPLSVTPPDPGQGYWCRDYWAKTFWNGGYWCPPANAPSPPVGSVGDGDAFRSRRRLTGAERRAIAETERLWEEHKTRKLADGRAADAATDKRLDEILDRHLGIVRRTEEPPPIEAQTVITGVSRETSRGIDLAGLENDLAAIRKLVADHNAALAELERQRIEREDIEMLILGSL